jgi:peptidoglycan/xylan/chitin deacetylase (PgdA/CDA1 family)
MLAREVDDSRQMLSEILNGPVEGFSYPYGDLDGPAVRAARRAGYRYAVATKKQVECGIHDWPQTYVGDRDFPLRLGVKLKVSPILARGGDSLWGKGWPTESSFSGIAASTDPS